jgi:hypothetical protein
VLATLKDEVLTLREPITGAVRARVENKNDLHGLAFSPDGTRLVVGESAR